VLSQWLSGRNELSLMFQGKITEGYEVTQVSLEAMVSSLG